MRLLVGLFLFLAVPSLQSQGISFLVDHFESVGGDSAIEDLVFDFVNRERQKEGLNPLLIDGHLRSAARQHSMEMLTRNYFSHTSPVTALKDPIDRIYRSGVSDGTVGENIAYYAYDTSATAVALKLMDLWMNSPGHRANILRAEFNRIGIGIVSRKDSVVLDTIIGGMPVHRVVRTKNHYATQNFTRRYLEFDNLSIARRPRRMVLLELLMTSERPLLAQAGNMTMIRSPQEGQIRFTVELPYEDSLTLSLAYLENKHTEEFVRFFHKPLSIDRHDLAEALSKSRIKGLVRQFRIETSEGIFLEGEGDLTTGETADLYVYYDNNTYSQFVCSAGRFDFGIPLTGFDTVTVEWAVGNIQVRPVTNRIRIVRSAIPESGLVLDRQELRKIFSQEY